MTRAPRLQSIRAAPTAGPRFPPVAGYASDVAGAMCLRIYSIRIWLAIRALALRRWVIESIFGGLGLPRGRPTRLAIAADVCRTRVRLTYDCATCRVDGDVDVWHERRWAEQQSLKIRSEDGVGRSGLDGAFVSSAIGMACFGESAKSAPKIAEANALALGGGVTVMVGAEIVGEKVLDVAVDTGEARIVMRRRFAADGASAGAALF